MSLATYFKDFCNGLLLDNLEEMKTTVGEIAKKLNSEYYQLDGDSESHMYIVGSVGRKTATKKTSDLDILFDLPRSLFQDYDRKEKGQTKLLQDVKKVLKERYPRTDIGGDGQVVVIGFDAYTVELVPGFKQSDNSFKYPDTHDGGSWKITNPLPEQKESNATDNYSNGNYRHLCRLIRKWKNTVGAKMGGLLIDTLVYNHFKDHNFYYGYSFKDYYQILIYLFKYLKDQDPCQTYWKALGSGQHISNDSKVRFINKAKNAYKKLNKAKTEAERINTLKELFGNKFAPEVVTSLSRKSTEEFIEDFYPVDIRNNLKIDCTVTQTGFQTFRLRDFLSRSGYLSHKKSLDFEIEYCDTKDPYQIFWKVRNVGPIAESRNMIRGQIIKSNLKIHQIGRAHV